MKRFCSHCGFGASYVTASSRPKICEKCRAPYDRSPVAFESSDGVSLPVIEVPFTKVTISSDDEGKVTKIKSVISEA